MFQIGGWRQCWLDGDDNVRGLERAGKVTFPKLKQIGSGGRIEGIHSLTEWGVGIFQK